MNQRICHCNQLVIGYPIARHELTRISQSMSTVKKYCSILPYSLASCCSVGWHMFCRICKAAKHIIIFSAVYPLNAMGMLVDALELCLINSGLADWPVYYYYIIMIWFFFFRPTNLTTNGDFAHTDLWIDFAASGPQISQTQYDQYSGPITSVSIYSPRSWFSWSNMVTDVRLLALQSKSQNRIRCLLHTAQVEYNMILFLCAMLQYLICWMLTWHTAKQTSQSITLQ